MSWENVLAKTRHLVKARSTSAYERSGLVGACTTALSTAGRCGMLEGDTKGIYI
jgi:hypothetical protein